jgi:hypothetical protein
MVVFCVQITFSPVFEGIFFKTDDFNFFAVKIWVHLDIKSGANPTIVIYNATGSLARFESKNILFYFVKRSSLLQRCSCKFKNRKIGA